jgi:hypothetical protein
MAYSTPKAKARRREAHMPYRKAGFEMGARSALCPWFGADRLQVAVVERGKRTTRAIWQKGWRRGRQMRDYQPVRRDVTMSEVGKD